MKDETRVFVIFRKRYNNHKDPIYAWTNNKKMVKWFIEQRNHKKYRVIKARYIDIERKFSEYSNQIALYKLEFMKLKSAKDGKFYYFITTANELKEYESHCQDMFSYLSSAEKIDNNRIEYFMNILGNFEKKYADALNMIGYIPKELESLFPGGEDSLDWINHGIDASYEDMDVEEFRKTRNLPGIENSSEDDIYRKIIYSMESFIRIMKDDM